MSNSQRISSCVIKSTISRMFACSIVHIYTIALSDNMLSMLDRGPCGSFDLLTILNFVTKIDYEHTHATKMRHIQ